MNDQTDSQLLRAYSEHGSDRAFAELARRHVDFVYSAALRMVCDSHLAQDVTQSVFVALAKNAAQLTDRAVLSGWLHRTAQNLAANAVRTEVRRRVREQEAAAMNELPAHEPDADWKNIAPHLDAALGELSESDRDALLLRYFERKSAREMARTLGISEEAAQKRTNRAVDRLRQAFSKQGFTLGASGLTGLILANAVHASPAGLAASISTAAALIGASVQTSTTVAATKTIAMTTLQKVLITTTLVSAVGTGIYQARRAALWRNQFQSLQKQSENTVPIEQLQLERDEALARLAIIQNENERLHQAVTDVPKLRGEVARLRTAQRQLPQADAAPLNDPAMKLFIESKGKADEIARHLERMPEKSIPELKLLHDVDWLNATREAKFDTDADVRKTLSHLRSLAKDRLRMAAALNMFIREQDGQLPSELSELKPQLKSVLNDPRLDDATLDAILERYKLLHTGKLADLPQGAWIIVEKAPVDEDYDTRAKFGNGTSTLISTGLNEAGDPDDKSY